LLAVTGLHRGLVDGGEPDRQPRCARQASQGEGGLRDDRGREPRREECSDLWRQGRRANVAPVTTIVGAATGLDNPGGRRVRQPGVAFTWRTSTLPAFRCLPRTPVAMCRPCGRSRDQTQRSANPIGVAVDRFGRHLGSQPDRQRPFSSSPRVPVATSHRFRTIGGPNSGLTHPVGVGVDRERKGPCGSPTTCRRPPPLSGSSRLTPTETLRRSRPSPATAHNSTAPSESPSLATVPS